MVKDQPGEKEKKSSSSSRPFDIENLFAPDKPTKQQKTPSQFLAAEAYRSNFTHKAALTVNGKYAYGLFRFYIRSLILDVSGVVFYFLSFYQIH